jgi:molybdopterin synthase catalytic subunit
VRSAIVAEPLDPAALLSEVAHVRNGASVLFVGTVREVNDGRDVTGIDYRAYESMAERELAAIVAECAEHHGTRDIVAEHRLGALGLGDASVVIAVAHPHRAGAFEAARWMLEELKRRLPIWKQEHYVDGERAWIDTSQSPSSFLPPPPPASEVR